jgi:anti-sigma-K factor RskA
MLGKQVVCPECNEFFVLELRNSLEQRKEDARRRAEREEELAKLWLKRAIWAAAIIVLSFVVMVVLSLWPELIYSKKD